MTAWTNLAEPTRDGADTLHASIPPAEGGVPVVTLGYRGGDHLVLNLADIPALRRLLDRVEQEVNRRG